MIVAIAQPISGVSANRETEIEIVYPGVAAGVLGKVVGLFMGVANGLPFTPVRLLACVMMGTVLVPLALLGYFTKLLGNCYVLTNRSVYPRRIIGSRRDPGVSLTDIAQIEIGSGAGYQFHRVGDLRLLGAQGNTLLVIPAVAFPERLKQIILDAREARRHSDAALGVIQKRK